MRLAKLNPFSSGVTHRSLVAARTNVMLTVCEFHAFFMGGVQTDNNATAKLLNYKSERFFLDDRAELKLVW